MIVSAAGFGLQSPMIWLAAYQFDFPSGSPIDLIAPTKRQVFAVSGWAEVARWSGNRFELKGRDAALSGFGHSVDINGNLRFDGRQYKNLATGRSGLMRPGPSVEANGISWQMRGPFLCSFDLRTSLRLPVRNVDVLGLDKDSAPNALVYGGDLWVLERKHWKRIFRSPNATQCAYDGQGRAAVVDDDKIIRLKRTGSGKWTRHESPVSDVVALYFHAGREILVTRGNVVKRVGSRSTVIFDGDVTASCLSANRLFIGGVGGTVNVIQL